MKFFYKSKFKPFKIVKTAVLNLLESAKVDFTSNQCGRIIAKFPHCGISTVKIPNLAAQVCLNMIFRQMRWHNPKRFSSIRRVLQFLKRRKRRRRRNCITLMEWKYCKYWYHFYGIFSQKSRKLLQHSFFCCWKKVFIPKLKF